MGRTCGEPGEIKKNTHPKYITALFRDQDNFIQMTQGPNLGGVEDLIEDGWTAVMGKLQQKFLKTVRGRGRVLDVGAGAGVCVGVGMGVFVWACTTVRTP